MCHASRIAGYSESPLSTKLSIKSGHVVALLDAPAELVLELPPEVMLRTSARGSADVVIAFFIEQRRLEGRIARLSEMIFPAGGLWIAWPRLASGVRTDVNADRVRAAAFALSLVDNKVCAIDKVWTALRVVWRLDARRSRKDG